MNRNTIYGLIVLVCIVLAMFDSSASFGQALFAGICYGAIVAIIARAAIFIPQEKRQEKRIREKERLIQLENEKRIAYQKQQKSLEEAKKKQDEIIKQQNDEKLRQEEVKRSEEVGYGKYVGQYLCTPSDPNYVWPDYLAAVNDENTRYGVIHDTLRDMPDYEEKRKAAIIAQRNHKPPLGNKHYAHRWEVQLALLGAKNYDEIVKKVENNIGCKFYPFIYNQINKTYKNLTNYLPAGPLYIGGGFYWGGQGHITTTGRSRSGKGSSLIIPALTDWFLQMNTPYIPSFIVLDPKGENLAVSGNYLKKAGYNVVAINPFDIPEISNFPKAGFNIFDTFDSEMPDFDAYVDMVIFALIPDVKHDDDFWDASARDMLSLYIRHLMTQDNEPKNFTTLWRWLRLVGHERVALLEQMGNNGSFDGGIKSESDSVAGQISGGSVKQIGSIYKKTHTVTNIFQDIRLRKCCSSSDFDFKKVASEKTAIFVCIDPEDLMRTQAWIRVLFGSFMRSLKRNYSPTRKVVMIMDEFLQIGQLKEAVSASNFLAGYNVTLWTIIQSYSQLKDLYPNSWEVFINNAAIRHYIRVEDNTTAEYLAKRMPMVIKENRDRSPDKNPLMDVNQIINSDKIVVEISDLNKISLFERQPYWNMELTKNNASPNPFQRSRS